MAVFGFLGIKMVWIFFWANKNLVKAGVFFWGMGDGGNLYHLLGGDWNHGILNDFPYIGNHIPN
jgi:hypothetical protein